MTTPVNWPPVGVTQRMLELTQLKEIVRRCSGGEDYASHLARYLTIRSAGLVEAVRDDVVDQHCRIVGPTRLHRRITSGLRLGLGATPKQLTEFVGTFDTAWGKELESLLNKDEAELRNSLSSLIGARKKIAHGDGVNLNSRQALEWADTALKLAKWFITRFDPLTSG